MADCCDCWACEIGALQSRQSSTLKTVPGINAVMFVAALISGPVVEFRAVNM
jgi:hypothetical protein